MSTDTSPASDVPASPSLDPELEVCRDVFRQVKTDVRVLVDGLSPEAFNWQPSPERWSVAQCLAHLHVAGGLLVPRLEDALAQAEALDHTRTKPVRYGFLGRWFIQANEPNPKRKVKTPSAFVPPAQHAPDVLVPSLLQLQDRLIRCAEQADSWDLSSPKVASPAARFLRFDVPTWLAVTEAHERRHLAQAQDVRAGWEEEQRGRGVEG